MRRPWKPILIFWAATLSGCSSFTSKPLGPEEAASAFESRRLNSRELLAALKSEGVVVRGAWSLTQLAAASRHLNPALAILRARVQTAEGALQTAGERPNPVVSFKPGYNTSTRGLSPWIIEPGLDFTIETGGKRDARRAEAIARVRAARLELETTAWNVRGEVRRALLAMHTAQSTRGEYRAQEAAQAVAARLLESQLREGSARPQDVAAARIPLHQTRLSLHDTDLLTSRSLAQLASAVGVPVSALRVIELDFSEVSRLRPVPAGSAARRHALTHRADILAALADYAASEEHLRLEVAKQYPDIKLGPGYKLDQNENKWTLGVGFELPLFNQHKGAIAEAEGKRSEAAARFRAVQARALGEIDLALGTFRAARAKAEAATALAIDVEDQTKVAETMKAAGELSEMEVSQRRVEQGAANLSRVQSRIQALEALGALEDALQTPAPFWK
jgi:outer membrane protein, heavy metal efflux system